MNRRILGFILAVEYRRSGQLTIRNHAAQIPRICAQGRGRSTARRRAYSKYRKGPASKSPVSI
jgi:hypothetical protein